MWMDVRVGGRDGDGKGKDSGRGDERPQSARGHAAVTPPPLEESSSSRQQQAGGSTISHFKQLLSTGPFNGHHPQKQSPTTWPLAHNLTTRPQLGHRPSSEKGPLYPLLDPPSQTTVTVPYNLCRLCPSLDVPGPCHSLFDFLCNE